MNNNKNIYDIIAEYYNEQGGIGRFFEDYMQFIENMDKIKVYKQNKNVCNLRKCKALKRNFRNRNIFDNNIELRYRLYSNCKDEKGIVIQQIIDLMHIIKYHLIHIGMRINENEDEDEDHDDNDDDDDAKQECQIKKSKRSPTLYMKG